MTEWALSPTENFRACGYQIKQVVSWDSFQDDISIAGLKIKWCDIRDWIVQKEEVLIDFEVNFTNQITNVTSKNTEWLDW